MKKRICRGLRAAADLILPRKCIVCGKVLLSEEEHLCLECLADMPMTFFWTMSHNPMADRFNEIIQKGIGMTDNEDSHERYAYAAALFFYHDEADYRLIPYQIKYHGNQRAGIFFGRMLGRKMASSSLFQDVDAIVPVPLHWARKWNRGYNQAEIIASGIAGSMGKPLLCNTLKRTRRTVTQTRMDIDEKTANVSGAFAVSEGMAGKQYRHILLVDDVFTTGSTLFACFVALRAVFPPSVRISVATLGFVGGA